MSNLRHHLTAVTLPIDFATLLLRMSLIRLVSMVDNESPITVVVWCTESSMASYQQHSSVSMKQRERDGNNSESLMVPVKANFYGVSI